MEHFEIAQCLIEHGANDNQADKDGFTPLHLAASLGNRDMIEFLLKNSASIDAYESVYGQRIGVFMKCGIESI